MITYKFGTVISIEYFDTDEYAKQLSLKHFGVIPPRPIVIVAKKTLKARVYEDTLYTQAPPILGGLVDRSAQEEY